MQMHWRALRDQQSLYIVCIKNIDTINIINNNNHDNNDDNAYVQI